MIISDNVSNLFSISDETQKIRDILAVPVKSSHYLGMYNEKPFIFDQSKALLWIGKRETIRVEKNTPVLGHFYIDDLRLSDIRDVGGITALRMGFLSKSDMLRSWVKDNDSSIDIPSLSEEESGAIIQLAAASEYADSYKAWILQIRVMPYTVDVNHPFMMGVDFDPETFAINQSKQRHMSSLHMDDPRYFDLWFPSPQ